MSTEEREKIEKLEELKNTIEVSTEPTPFYSVAKKLGFSSMEANAMQKMGIVHRKRVEGDPKRFFYYWGKQDPNRETWDKIYKRSREIARETQKRSKQKKLEEQRRQEEEARALREKKAKEVKEKKESRKNQGAVLDITDTEFINDMKAKSEGLKPEDIVAKAKPNIPIEVSVVTEGDKKTVTIKIEV